MPRSKIQLLLALPLIVAFIGLVACSTAPPGPKAGTPAFYWQAAKETWAARDYMKTLDHLAQVSRTENEFALNAMAMRLVVNSGLIRAYMDLAENFETGARANVFKPMPLRKVSSDYMKQAEIRALDFGETYLKFAKALGQLEKVKLDFAFPDADMTEIREIKKIVAGTLPDDATISSVERRKIQQSLALAVAAAVGAPNDIAKARAAFESGSAEVPRETFTMAMANNLYDQATLFSRKKLDNPQRVELFVNEAKDALKGVKESKETKSLQAKLDKLLKESKER